MVHSEIYSERLANEVYCVEKLLLEIKSSIYDLKSRGYITKHITSHRKNYRPTPQGSQKAQTLRQNIKLIAHLRAYTHNFM
jgi:DNA-binding PadR family transcriptional regulator